MKPILNDIKGSEQNAFDWTCFTEYSAWAIFNTKRGHIVAFIRKGKSQHANFQLPFFSAVDQEDCAPRGKAEQFPAEHEI